MKRHARERGTQRRITFALRLLRGGFSYEEAARGAYISEERLQRTLGIDHRKQLMEGDAMPQTARVRQLVEDIEAEAKGNNMPLQHAAALRWAQEGAEQNIYTTHEWADTLAALQQRTLSEGGTPIGVRDLREDAPATGRGAARLQDTSGPRLQGAVEYRSEAMEALVAARLKQLSDSGRPADRMGVVRELVNSGRVKTEGPGGGTRMGTPTVGRIDVD